MCYAPVCNSSNSGKKKLTNLEGISYGKEAKKTWDTVMLSNERGGLEIKNLKVQNKSLLMKWLWRYIVVLHAPFPQVLYLQFSRGNK